MGGTIGSYAPGSRGRFVLSGAPGEGFNLEGDGQRPVTYYVTARNFAPRKPGFAPLEVRLLDAQNQLVADPLKIEFWIEATYSGAFRVGVAGILMGSLDEHYRAETRPGSQQREIVQQGSSVMDLDVVIGYSPYLDAGGRPAASPRRSASTPTSASGCCRRARAATCSGSSPSTSASSGSSPRPSPSASPPTCAGWSASRAASPQAIRSTARSRPTTSSSSASASSSI
jgi:hypothetical protein